MVRSGGHFLLSAALLMLLSGCADVPKVFQMNAAPTPAQPSSQAEVWPPPPEKARYRYVGELVGEANFIESKASKTESFALTALKWLVGLVGGAGEDPVVLQRPQTGMVDSKGRILVSDVSRQGIYVFDRPGGRLEIWEQGDDNHLLHTPVGIAETESGQILVADAQHGRIFRLSAQGRPLGSFGQHRLKRPTGLAYNPAAGHLFVADTHDHNIKVFNRQGRLLKVIGKRGEGKGELNFPTHLSFQNGRLYVTDTMNSRVQIFNADGRYLRQFGERGLHIGNMVRPKGITLDSHGHIYVVESLYDNLLVYDQQGRTLLAIGGTGKKAGNFYLPAGVWSDQQDRIYIADMFNGRIMVIQYLGAQAAANPDRQ